MPCEGSLKQQTQSKRYIINQIMLKKVESNKSIRSAIKQRRSL